MVYAMAQRSATDCHLDYVHHLSNPCKNEVFNHHLQSLVQLAGSLAGLLSLDALSVLHTVCNSASRSSPPVLLQIVPAGGKERLAFLARQMDVDILVTGHTHEFKVHC